MIPVDADAEAVADVPEVVEFHEHDPTGTLHGLPATIKASFETAGLRTTCGAPIYSKHVPAVNADALQRLENAGSFVMGKTNVPIHAGDRRADWTLVWRIAGGNADHRSVFRGP